MSQQQVDTQQATVDQLDGTVRNDQATIDSAKLNLVYCHITSPVDGRIGLRLVDPGNIVHATDTNALLVITQLQPIAVLFTLPEDSLPSVAQQMAKGTLEVDAYSRDDQTKLASGKLLTIDNQIDQTTGTGKLKAVFDNKDNALWPNQFVNVRLLLEIRKDSTIDPGGGDSTGPAGNLRVCGEIGQDGRSAPGDDCLHPGQRFRHLPTECAPSEVVVTDGQDKLQQGSKVEIRTGGSNRRQAAASWGQPRFGKSCGRFFRESSAFRNAMNPSRLFILRPVATALLMVAIMLVGIVAYRQLPVSALPEVDYPTIQVMTFYPGADPDVMASSVTAPLERQFGQVPGLSQMTSTSSFGSSVITLQFDSRSEYRRRGATGAGRDQRRADISADGPAESADLQQSKSGGLADSHPGADFEDAAAFASRGSCGHGDGPEDFASHGRGPGFDQRRTEAGGANPGESHCSGVLRLEPGRCANRARGCQCRSGQGNAQRSAAVFYHRSQ